MGEKPHSRLQKLLLRILEGYEDALGLEALPEQRLQINSSRFRVPDLMLIASTDSEPRIVREPALLCVEVLSSEDRMSAIEERIFDYASLGVPCSWVLDPWRGLAYTAGPDGVLHPEKKTLLAIGGAIAVDVENLFQQLEQIASRSSGEPPRI